MEAHGRDGKAVLLAELSDLDQIDEALHVGLDLLQAAEPVQLGKQFLQTGGGGGVLLGLGLGLSGAGGGGGGGGLPILGGVGPLGDEIPGVEGGLALVQAVPAAEGGQGVGALVDESGLFLADHVVHGGKEQEQQSEHIHKFPGQGTAGDLVTGPHPGKKGRSPEAGVFADGGGELPEEHGGDRIALGVNGVVVFHMPGRDGGPVAVPHPQGAGPEEGVRLLIELLAQCAVGELPPEGRDAGVVLLVHLRGAEWVFQWNTPRLLENNDITAL